MTQELPIVGLWYKVISGPYKDFIGECVSFNVEEKIEVVLQNSEWISRAVYVNEIERIDILPTKELDIQNSLKN